jgi:dTDP-4-dehydrorhamnose reductase
MPQILVTGANGQLGSELQKLCSNHKDWQFVFTDIDQLDITDLPMLKNFCSQYRFQYIMNCAAYTAVDKAESDTGMAMKINRDAVKNLAVVAAQLNAVLIHISTDYVFDGTACVPYTEEQPVHPQSAYGHTKAAGEQEALSHDKTIIIRTAWLYSTFGNNFVKTMLRLGNERQELGIVFDQVGTPTYAEDLASAMLAIVDHTEKQGIKPGIYHFSNEGVCSWYDFAWEIMNYTGTHCNVKPIGSKDYPVPAKRPSYSVFNKAKIKDTFHIESPYWKASLYKCLNELINKK